MTHSKFSRASALLFSALLVSSMAAAQGASSKDVKLADGTPVRLTLDETLSSATAQVGDTIHLEVAEDVRVGNVTVIPAGASAFGHVVEAEHKKRLGRGGKLDFAVDDIKLANGANLKVRASSEREGKDKEGQVIIGTVLVSPLFMLMHGKDVNIPQGTTLTAYIDGDAAVDIAAGNGALSAQNSADPPPTAHQPELDPSASQVQQPGIDPATVVLKSTPDGADVTMDGNYVGSTPSTLRVTPGHHIVTLEKQGFKIWQKNLDVTPDGIITVSATMDQN